MSIMDTVLCAESHLSELVDEATDNNLKEVNWKLYSQICNLIRTGYIRPESVEEILKRKLTRPTFCTSLYVLKLLEYLALVDPTFQEQLTKQTYCDMLRDLAKETPYENVKDAILQLIQTWILDFRDNDCLRNTRDRMETEGFRFPPPDLCTGISLTQVCQKGKRETCQDCNMAIGFMERRHYCGNCPRIFCYRCSPATLKLTEKEGLLCDNCYTEPAAAPSLVPVVPSALLNQPRTDCNMSHKTEEELREEEELQLVLAISLAEAEEREKFLSATLMASTSQSSPQSSHQSSSQSTGQASHQSAPSEEVENELTCGICVSYFEQAATLSCSHSFCYGCISSWRQEHNDCPICRSEITGMAPSRALDNMVAAIGNLTRTAPAEDSGRSATSQKKKV